MASGTNAVAGVCLAFAGVGTVVALTLSDADAGMHYAKKWLLFGSLLVGIVGWAWGRGHTPAQHKLGVALILGLFAGFALHAGLIDSVWREGNVGSRLAMLALGVALGTSAGLVLVKDKKTQLFGGGIIWLWLMGWWAFFMFAPRTMQIEYEVGGGYGEPHSAFFYYVFACVVGVGGLVVLILWGEEISKPAGSPARYFEPPTMGVGNSKFGDHRDVYKHDLTDDWTEGDGQ